MRPAGCARSAPNAQPAHHFEGVDRVFLRSMIAISVATTAVVSAAPAQAAEFRAFEARAFATAQAKGRPILVEVHADWCPVCRKQAPSVARILRAPKFRDLVVFKLDFDSQRADWRRLGVQRQSTMIAFSGKRERGRLVASTDPKAIAALIRSSLR